MGLLAVFFFNFTMAITLASLANILHEAKGTAFGLASFSLAIGALPALLGLRLEHPLVLSAMSLISALALGVSLTLVKDTVATGPFGHERLMQASNDTQVTHEPQAECVASNDEAAEASVDEAAEASDGEAARPSDDQHHD